MTRIPSRFRLPRQRRTPLFVAAAVLGAGLVAVPVTAPERSPRVIAQADSAIVPIDLAPHQLSDGDYLARAAADRRAAAVRAEKARAVAAAAERERLARAERRAAAARRASRSSERVSASAPVAYGSPRAIARDQLAARGWSDQFGCLDNLWTRESGWRTTASNPSGAYGIPQALPGSKMASAGADWRTNPATQIRWGLGYISGRYGDPCGAWSHFQNRGWY